MKPYVIDYRVGDWSSVAQKLREGENSSIARGELRLHESAPLAKTWNPPELYWVDPRLPTTDFFKFSPHAIGLKWRVHEIEEIRRELERNGEFLPVRFGMETHFLWHPTAIFRDYDWDLSMKYGPYEDGWYVPEPAFHPWADSEYWVIVPEYCPKLFLPDETGLMAAVERHKLTGLAPIPWEWPSPEYAAKHGKPEYGIAPRPRPAAPAAPPKKKKKTPAKPAPPIEPEATDGIIRLREAKTALWPAIADVLQRFREENPEAEPTTACFDVNPATGSLYFSFNEGDTEEKAALSGFECAYQGWEIRSGAAFVQAFENACNSHTYIVEKEDGSRVTEAEDGFEAFEKAVIDGIAEATRGCFENGDPAFRPRWLIVDKEGDYFHRWEWRDEGYVKAGDL